MNANLEELVKEINAVNRAWKEASEMGDCLKRISQSLKDLKDRLQVRLLRQYAPDRVYLELDTENPDTQGEELYSLRLRQPLAQYKNAAHLPVRVARNVLSEQELQQFIQH